MQLRERSAALAGTEVIMPRFHPDAAYAAQHLRAACEGTAAALQVAQGPAADAAARELLESRSTRCGVACGGAGAVAEALAAFQGDLEAFFGAAQEGAATLLRQLQQGERELAELEAEVAASGAVLETGAAAAAQTGG